MTTPSPPPGVPPPAPRRLARGVRAVLRLVTVAGCACVALLVALALAQTFLNTDRGRTLLAAALSRRLGQELTIGGLELRLLKGLALRDVRLGDAQRFPDDPLVVLDRATLTYSLQQLARGVLRVDALRVSGLAIRVVSRAGGSNLPGVAGPADAEPPPPSRAPPLRLPPLPVAVELGEARLADVSVRVDWDGRTRLDAPALALAASGGLGAEPGIVHLEVRAGAPLVLELAGTAPLTLRSALALVAEARTKGPDEVWLDADLRLPDATVDLGDGPRPAAIGLATRVGALAAENELGVASLVLDLGPGGRVTGRGRVRDPAGAPRIDVLVDEGWLDLGALAPLAEPFVPGLAASGTVRLAGLRAEGGLDGGSAGVPFVVAGDVALGDVSVRDAAAGLALEALDGRVAVELVKLLGFVPTEALAAGTLTAARVAAPAAGDVRDLALTLEGRSESPGRHRVGVRLDARWTPPPEGPLAPDVLPVAVEASALLDQPGDEVRDVHVVARAGELLAAVVRGRVAERGRGAVAATAEADVALAAARRALPAALLGPELGALDLDGRVRVAAQATGDLGGGALAASGTVTLADVAATGLPADARVAGLGGAIDATLALEPRFRPGRFALRGALTSGPLAAGADVAAARSAVRVEVSGVGLPPGEVRADAEVALGGARVGPEEDGQAAHAHDLRLAATLEGDPVRGDGVLRSAEAVVDGRAGVRAEGRVRGFGAEQLAATVTLDRPELADVLALARSAVPGLAAPLETLELHGRPAARIDARGRLPSVEERARLVWPLAVSATASLDGVEAAWPARDLAHARLGGELRLEGGLDDAELRVQLAATEVRRVHVPEAGDGERPGTGAGRHVSLELEASLAGRDRVTLRRAQAAVLDQGVYAIATGEAAGLRRFLGPGARVTAESLLEHVAADVETFVGFVVPERTEIGPLTLAGGTSMRVGGRLRPGRDATLTGTFFFDDLDLVVPGQVVVEGLTGRFPVRKTLAIGANAPAPPNAAPRPAFYDALRGASPSRDNVRIERLETPALALRDLYLDLLFEERSLRVDRFGAGLLAGWVGGHVDTSFSQAESRVVVTTEFAGIDLSRLLPGERALAPAEAAVSGDARLRLDLARGGAEERLGLGDLDADVHLTRIGERALDELLRFVDPTGTNSSIGAFRTVLRTTDLRVDRVEIPIRNGTLGMRVEYQVRGHLLDVLSPLLPDVVYDRLADLLFSTLTASSFEVPAISLLTLARTADAGAALGRLSGLAPILDLVGSERAVVDDASGAVVLR